MKTRNPVQYVLERTTRLLVPLIFGMLVIVVPQAYFQAIFHGVQLSQYDFLQIYGLYLTTLPESQMEHNHIRLVFRFRISFIRQRADHRDDQEAKLAHAWNGSGIGIMCGRLLYG